jgi:hypothetical protein
MTQGSRNRATNTAIMLSIAGLVGVFFGGIWVGSGGLSILNHPTPPIIYITPEPGPSATPATASASPVTAASIASTEISPTAGSTVEPTAVPTAAPTRAPTPRPPTPTPALPNLAVHTVAYSLPFCNEWGTASADVVNNGPGSSRAVQIALTDTWGDHVPYSGGLTVPALAPGAHFSASFNVRVTVGCGHDHVFTFRIDPPGTLSETRTDDNVRSVSHFVQLYEPNLKVTGLRLSTSHPQCLLAFDVIATIANEGPLTTGRTANLLVSDHAGTAFKLAAANIPIIPAHSTATATTRLLLGPDHCGETHQLSVMADSYGSIDEYDEDDNDRSLSYTLEH